MKQQSKRRWRWVRRLALFTLAAVGGATAYAFFCPDDPELTADNSAGNYVLDQGQERIVRQDDRAATDRCETAERCVLGVHGVFYSISKGLYFDPFATVYRKWRAGLGDLPLDGIGWESSDFDALAMISGGEGTDGSLIGKIVRNADRLTTALTRFVEARPDRYHSAICHSLGCRVLVRGLAETPSARIERLILLNAAICSNDPAWRSANLKGVQVLSIWTDADVPLRRAERGLCGESGKLVGLGHAPKGAGIDWSDIEHNGGGFFAGCRLCRNNPHRYFDHLYSYESDVFWPAIRTFISG